MNIPSWSLFAKQFVRILVITFFIVCNATFFCLSSDDYEVHYSGEDSIAINDQYLSLIDSGKAIFTQSPNDAKVFFAQAGSLITETNDQRMITVFNGIGASCQQLSEHDSSLHYFHKALEVAQLK